MKKKIRQATAWLLATTMAFSGGMSNGISAWADTAGSQSTLASPSNADYEEMASDSDADTEEYTDAIELINDLIASETYDFNDIITDFQILHYDETEVTDENPLAVGESAVLRFTYELNDDMLIILNQGDPLPFEYQLQDEALAFMDSYDMLVGINFENLDISDTLSYLGFYGNDGYITFEIYPDNTDELPDNLYIDLMAENTSELNDVALLSSGDSNWISVDGIEGGMIDFDESEGIIIESEQTVTSAIIPAIINGVEVSEIDYGAFSDCHDLVEVVVPEGVTKIGYGAFRNCENLAKLVLPESLTEFGYSENYGGNGKPGECGAFSYCDQLISAGGIGSGCNIEFGWTTKIPKWAFRACFSLESVIIPDDITEIDEYAFISCKGLKEVILPEGFQVIGYGAFLLCQALENISLPDSLLRIDGDAFTSTGLENKESNVNDGVIYADNWVVDGSGAVGACSIREGTKGIGQFAFAWNTQLTEVYIPDSVEYMGSKAFYWCSELENVRLSPNTTHISEYAFNYVNLKNLSIPEGVTHIEDYAFDNKSSTVIVEDFIIPDSVVYLGKEAISIKFTGDYIIGNGLTELHNTKQAYDGICVIGNNISDISDYAFSKAKFTNILIPENCKTIGVHAFGGSTCTSAGVIGSGCDYEYGWTDEIPAYAFNNLKSLSYAIIPNSIQEIGRNAFYECSGLTDVYFDGSEEEWNQILIDNGNEVLQSATIHFNSSGPESSQTGDHVESKVRYLKEWDAENQMLYFSDTANTTDLFDLNSRWKAIITEATDIAILDQIDELVGQYVYVTIQKQSDEDLDYDELLSMESIETCYGKITDVNDISIEIDGLYDLTEEISRSYINTKVIYWIKDDQIIEYECLMEEKGDLKDWDPDTRELKLSDYLNDHYILSVLADENNLYDFVGEEIYIYYDRNHFVYHVSKIPENGYYFVPEELTEEQELLQEYLENWYDAYEDFIEAIKEGLDEYAGTDDAIRASTIESQAEAMKAVDESSRSKYITFNSDFPDAWKDDAYIALSEFLYDNACSSPNFDDVDFASSTAGVTLVKDIMKCMQNQTEEYEYGNLLINIHIFQLGSTKFGELTCYNKNKPSTTYGAVICSTQSETEKAIQDYYTELTNLETKAIFNIANAVYTDVLKKSLSSYTKEFLEKSAKKYSDKIANTGIGDLFKNLNDCYNYYTYAKNIYALKSGEVEDILPKLTSIEFKDNTIEKNAASKTIKLLNKASLKLNNALAEYVNGTLSVSQWEKFKLGIGCPIEIIVTDQSGEEIGYSNSEDIWYSDSIRIEERGDGYVIDIYDNDLPTFYITATDYGTMGCSIEECDDGVPLGRVNFFDVDLIPDQELSFTLTESLLESDEIITINTDNETIYADEYLSASENGGVEINCDAGDGGSVFGTGTYVRGDIVTLHAVPDEGYRFIGWYDEDLLVSIRGIKEFVANSDQNLSAVFALENVDEEEYYTIEVASTAGGTVICDGEYISGELVTLTAVPDEGYEFEGWYYEDILISTDAVFKFIAVENMTIYANYIKTDTSDDGQDSDDPVESGDSSIDDEDNTGDNNQNADNSGDAGQNTKPENPNGDSDSSSSSSMNGSVSESTASGNDNSSDSDSDDDESGSSSGSSAGSWILDHIGWWFKHRDGSYPAGEWRQLVWNGNTDWYYFKPDGYMATGWFTDTDGNKYYLNPVSDGTQGRMLIGWQLIDGKWYYFNEVSDGTKGALLTNRKIGEYFVDEDGVRTE